MESWIPVWDSISDVYKNETIKYIKKRFPEINDTDRKLKESIIIRENLIKIGLENKPIYPYTWHRYHGGLRFLSESDVYTEFFLLMLYKTSGVNGIILWGYEKNQTVQNNTLDFFKNYSYLFDILKIF